MSISAQLAYADCIYQSPPDVPSGVLEKSFKVLNMNVYGQNIESLQMLIAEGDAECEDRLRTIGEHIQRSAYDIVGTQEWHPDTLVTCDGRVLAEKISAMYPSTPSTQFYKKPEKHKWVHYQWGQPDAYHQKTGGLGIISATPFLWNEYNDSDFGSWELYGKPVETTNVYQYFPTYKSWFPNIREPSAYGFIFSRIYLRYPDIAVDVYVTHIRGGASLTDKKKMLSQLREGIHKRSGNTGGFPVLVMGDFNIGGPNPHNTSSPCAGHSGYSSIMENLGNPTDLWLESKPNETGTTSGFETSDPTDDQRIDFIFIPHDPYLSNSAYEITLKDPAMIKLIELGKSDHKGIVAELDVRQKATRPPVMNINPTTLNFDDTPHKDTHTEIVTITNPGLSTLEISISGSQTALGQSPNGFSWESLNAKVLPKESKSFIVHFSPKSGKSGVFNDQLSIISNTVGSPHVIKLNGRSTSF